MIDQCRH